MEIFVSSTDVLVAVLLFWNSLFALVFLRAKTNKRRWFDFLALVILIVYWIGLLLFAQSVKVKLFVSVLLLTSLIIRLLLLRNRSTDRDSARVLKT